MELIENLGPIIFCAVAFCSSGILLFLHIILPAQDDPAFSSWPSSLFLGIQLIVSLLMPIKKKEPNGTIISASVEPPVSLDRGRLMRFKQLVGHASTNKSMNEVPLLYPVVECFRLIIQSMLLPSFPVSILGAVLLRSRHVLLRPLDSEVEKLNWRVKINPKGLRSTAKGDLEIDILSTATDSDGLAVWKSVVTVIVLGKNRNKAHKGAEAASSQSAVSYQGQEIEVWSLDGSVGRRFGLLSGDLNPIHIHWTLSRLFGFKRPIAHALYLVARAEACIRSAGVPTVYPCIMETEFKRPTLLPAKLSMTIEVERGGAGSKTDAATWTLQAGSEKGLGFSVTTTLDIKKDVILGRLWQGKSAMKKAA